MKVQIEPFGKFTPSKNRNTKKKAITFVDLAGKPIIGSIKKHYLQVYQKQKERFDAKYEAFHLLQEEELKELYLNGDKIKVKGSNDKLALSQAYYDLLTNKYKELTVEHLNEIDVENTLLNLNDIEVKALKDTIEEKTSK